MSRTHVVSLARPCVNGSCPLADAPLRQPRGLYVICATVGLERFSSTRAPSHKPLARSNGEVNSEVRAQEGSPMATDLPASVDSTILHLVTPQSQGKPLCGEKSPDAAIGSYCEHIGDDGEWCREVFGKGGKTGKSCEACLTLYPSLLWGQPKPYGAYMPLQTVVTVWPYPQSIRDEFQLLSSCLSEDYMIEREPSVMSQRMLHGKVALTLLTRIVPKPPASVGHHPHKSDSDEKQQAQMREIRRVRRGSRK